MGRLGELVLCAALALPACSRLPSAHVAPCDALPRQPRQHATVYVDVSPTVSIDAEVIVDEVREYYAQHKVTLAIREGPAPSLDHDSVSLSFVDPDEFFTYTDQPRYLPPFFWFVGEIVNGLYLMPNPLIGYALVDERRAYVRVFPSYSCEELADTAEHELGHLFSLTHQKDTLMAQSGSPKTLTAQQANQMRDYLARGKTYDLMRQGFDEFHKRVEEAEGCRDDNREHLRNQ